MRFEFMGDPYMNHDTVKGMALRYIGCQSVTPIHQAL